MTYAETLEYLFQKLPIYQRQGALAYKPDIGNIRELCDLFGNPQDSFKSIHLAGTNGKGSTSHILTSILMESGYRTGLHTSPHFKDLRERIRVNGIMCPESFITKKVAKYREMREGLAPSFFELTVALSFLYFAEQQVDVAVIETGLGGRLDATNIITPELSVITNVSYDHTHLLGETLEEIATEKAGIIKENVPVVIGENKRRTRHVFESVAEKKHAPIHHAEALHLPVEKHPTDLPGKFQKKNLRTALAAVSVLREKGWNIPEKGVHKGSAHVLENTGFMGRWQTLGKDPLTVCDMAHNEDAIKELLAMVENTSHKNLHFVIGLVNDKEVDRILPYLPVNASYYLCKADIPRAMEQKQLQEHLKEYQLQNHVYTDVHTALKDAREKADKKDLVIVTGSAFVVAEVL